MNQAAADAYRVRFRRVLEHIDAHLDGDLTVERLSGVAAFSKHHFHRQFSELFGMGVHEYVTLVRMRRASYRLVFHDHARILDIAMESGYESHEAFSRAFKKTVGQTPSEFRDSPEWDAWHAIYQRAKDLRSLYMKPAYSVSDVNLILFPETRVAVLEHRGDPKLLGDSVRRFIEWRKQNGLSPRVSATFNILYDDPALTSPDAFRFDLCAATERGVPENAEGVIEKTIPAGRCAVLRHIGTDDTFAFAFTFLYSTWLPSSGEEPRDFPLFLQRVAFGPDVPEHEAIVDVFLPVR